MKTFFAEFWNWAEVWAVMIPLVVLLFRPHRPPALAAINIYLVLALVLNMLIDISWLFRPAMPDWLQNNNYLYNIQSITRFACFSFFFMRLSPFPSRKLINVLSALTLLLVIINFIFFEPFFQGKYLSSRLFALESAVLLVFCLQYYYRKFQEEETMKHWPADFWIVSGISIYVVFNFPYFLFYTSLIDRDVVFVTAMWNFHNITFVILCIFIARGLYVATDK